MMKPTVFVQGIYVADLAFWAHRIPVKGETLIGTDFQMGNGGKGSNQAITAVRNGADVKFISKIGNDEFGKMALSFYAKEKLSTDFVFQTDDAPTGAATINIIKDTGENAIIVVPGAADLLNESEFNKALTAMKPGDYFLTQLETPVDLTEYSIRQAREVGAITVLNPAPANTLSSEIYPFIDLITPNEVEASQMTGIEVTDAPSAEKACDDFLAKGVKTAMVTLGSLGVYIKNNEYNELVPAITAGNVIDTAGAGDVFNGALVAALASGKNLIQATIWANTAAGISVTRKGTAQSAPFTHEVADMVKH